MLSDWLMLAWWTTGPLVRPARASPTKIAVDASTSAPSRSKARIRGATGGSFGDLGAFDSIRAWDPLSMGYEEVQTSEAVSARRHIFASLRLLSALRQCRSGMGLRYDAIRALYASLTRPASADEQAKRAVAARWNGTWGCHSRVPGCHNSWCTGYPRQAG